LLAESEPAGQLKHELFPAEPVRPVVSSYPDDPMRCHHHRHLAQMIDKQPAVCLARPRLARDDEDAVLVSHQILQAATQFAAVDHGTSGPGADEPDGERVITAVPGPVASGQCQQGTHPPLELSAERRVRLGHAPDELAELTLPGGVRYR